MLSVIIPAYNEQDSIAEAVKKVSGTMPNAQIIVVDDGSTDRTSYILDRMTEQFDRVTFKKNQGYSAAIAAGIRHAKGTYISYIDADLQYDPEDCRRLYDAAIKGDFDLMVGKLAIKYSQLSLSIRSAIFRKISRMILGIRRSDINSLKVIRKSKIQGVRSKRWGIDAELLYRMRTNKIGQLQITCAERTCGESKVTAWSCVRTVFELIKIRLSGSILPSDR